MKEQKGLALKPPRMNRANLLRPEPMLSEEESEKLDEVLDDFDKLFDEVFKKKPA